MNTAVAPTPTKPSYFNVKIGLTSKGKLLTLEQISKMDLPESQDAYISIFKYNEDHKKRVDATGTVSGIKDVTTDILVWDFDSSENPSKALEDTVALAHRLVDDNEVDPDAIQCYYSGSKGFHVVLPLDAEITPEQFKKATSELANGLNTFDSVVSDPARVIRMEYTKHPKTGLFKIPLSVYETEELTMEQIKELAKTQRDDVEFKNIKTKLPEKLFKVEEKKTVSTLEPTEFDYKNPPKGWKQYKWAIAQGYFESGERHSALMVLAATCRGLGYDKEQTYYICKSALKKQARRTGTDEFAKEELWENIIENSVFSDRWEGGQYSPENNVWLRKYCERMGFDTNAEKKESPVVELDTLINQFVDYSTNFEQNLIKTGIAGLDANLILSTSTLNGLLGQPGSGKTTVAIEILKNSSINGIPSMFFSLDMGPPLVFSKLVQKESGVGFKSALQIFREQKERRESISALIKEKYKNVGFNFRCGLTVNDMRMAITEQTERTGVKPKLIVVDYLENIAGPYADPTANAGMITNQLKDLATEMEVCILLLLQTQKHSTPDISDPLLSMKQIKGSSAIEQNCSVVLTLWREGYNPNYIHDDKFISFALVKNRFGPLWKGDFGWEPVKGHITSLTEEQQEELELFKKQKRDAKLAELKEKSDFT